MGRYAAILSRPNGAAPWQTSPGAIRLRGTPRRRSRRQILQRAWVAATRGPNRRSEHPLTFVALDPPRGPPNTWRASCVEVLTTMKDTPFAFTGSAARRRALFSFLA